METASQRQGSWKFERENGQIVVKRDDSLHQDEQGQDESVGGLGQFGTEGEVDTGMSVERSVEASASATAYESDPGGEQQDQDREEGGAGASLTAGHAEATAGASASAGADGVAVEASASGQFQLVGTSLWWYATPRTFSFGGQEFKAELGAELSAEVVAEAEGKVGLTAGGGNNGLEVGGEAGVEAFAGARAGVKILGGLKWNDTDGDGWTDLVGAEVGLNGMAGAAAVANLSLSLVPMVEFSANLGLAVGFGAGLSGSIKMNAIGAAKVGWALAANGIAVTWDGLKDYSEQIGDWLEQKGRRFRRKASRALDSFIRWRLRYAL